MSYVGCRLRQACKDETDVKAKSGKQTFYSVKERNHTLGIGRPADRLSSLGLDCSCAAGIQGTWAIPAPFTFSCTLQTRNERKPVVILILHWKCTRSFEHDNRCESYRKPGKQNEGESSQARWWRSVQTSSFALASRQQDCRCNKAPVRAAATKIRLVLVPEYHYRGWNTYQRAGHRQRGKTTTDIRSGGAAVNWPAEGRVAQSPSGCGRCTDRAIKDVHSDVSPV